MLWELEGEGRTKGDKGAENDAGGRESPEQTGFGPASPQSSGSPRCRCQHQKALLLEP